MHFRPFRGVAVVIHDAVGEEPWLVPMRIARPSSLQRRTMGVSFVVVRVLVHNRNRCGGKFFIIGVVPWIDANFVDMVDGFHGGGRKKMYISDKGNVTLCVFECLCDGAEGLGRFFVWGGDANDFATGFSEGEALFDSGLYILGWGGGHGLDANGIFASNGGVADANFSSGYALCVEARDAIGMVLGLICVVLSMGS